MIRSHHFNNVKKILRLDRISCICDLKYYHTLLKNRRIYYEEELFYNVLTEITGVTVTNEGDLFSIISELSTTKKKYLDFNQFI